MSKNKTKPIVLTLAGFLLCATSIIAYQYLKAPTVSIVVSTYNRETSIEPLLSTLKNQTFNDFEVIFVDDGSTDATVELLNEYAQNARRTRVLTKTDAQSLADLHNNAYDMARGKYIALVDDSLLLAPKWLEESVLKLNEEPQITGTYSDRKTMPGNKRVKSELARIMYTDTLSAGAPVIRKDFMDEFNIRHDATSQAPTPYGLIAKMLEKGAVLRSLTKAFLQHRVYTTKSSAYLNAQKEEATAIQENLQNYFMTDETKSKTPCHVYENILDKPAFSRLFNIDEITIQKERACQDEFADMEIKWEFKQPYWTDQIGVVGNRIKRVHAGAATILSQENNEITVKWDDWGQETFVCDENNICTLKK